MLARSHGHSNRAAGSGVVAVHVLPGVERHLVHVLLDLGNSGGAELAVRVREVDFLAKSGVGA